MPYAQFANATLHGVTGNISWPSAGSASGYQVSGWTLTRSQPVTEYRNGSGKTNMLIVDPETVLTMELDLVLRCSSKTAAANNALLPPPTEVVTLSNFPAPAGDSDMINCANWRLAGDPKLTCATETEAKFSFTLKQILGSDVLTASQLLTEISS